MIFYVSKPTMIVALLVAMLSLAGCGTRTSPGERAVVGGLIGAGVGAGVGKATKGSAVGGAGIGAASGMLLGVLFE